MENKVPVLITLTAPSCGGKSFLFNYIRDVAKLPCLISTTTRAPRFGEVDGVDYHFISEEQSKEIEARDGFAELAIYRGVRYGVTKEEFLGKLTENGLAFLIVEPSGIDHYVKPALDAGAVHMKYFIHTDIDVRISRLKKRIESDIKMAAGPQPIAGPHTTSPCAAAIKAVNPHIDRLIAMLTVEMQWGTATEWDRILFGDKSPEYNLQIILNDVKKKQSFLAEPIGTYD